MDVRTGPSSTYTEKRGLITETLLSSQIRLDHVTPAKIYIAKNSKTKEEYLEFIAMLGLSDDMSTL